MNPMIYLIEQMVKQIDPEALLAKAIEQAETAPHIGELLALVRGIATDFKTICDQNKTILKLMTDLDNSSSSLVNDGVVETPLFPSFCDHHHV